MAADVTVFDPATIRDVATFADPNHYAVGVKHVFVNGQAVVKDGAITDAPASSRSATDLPRRPWAIAPPSEPRDLM